MYKGRVLATLLKFSEAKAVLLKIESTEIPKDLMDEVQIMLNFCVEQERKFAELKAKRSSR